MAAEGKVFTDADILALVARGELITAIIDMGGGRREEEFVARCSALHNEGKIDLVEVGLGSGTKSLSGHLFFFAQQFFISVIPTLSAPVERVMELVAQLVEQGGDDMASTLPNAAFREWCKANKERAREVIDKAVAGEALAIQHLTFALEAEADLEGMRAVVTQFNDGRRLSALTAISRTVHDAAEAAQTVNLLAPLLDQVDDDLVNAAVLGIVFAQLGGHTAPVGSPTYALIDAVLAREGDMTHHAAAHALWADRTPNIPAVAQRLLDNLAGVNFKNTRTVEIMDHGLRTLLRSGLEENAITFVTQLAVTNSALDLSQFSSFMAELVQGPEERFHGVVVRWLLSGKRPLCEGLHVHFRDRELGSRPLSIQMAPFTLDDVQTQFICRKAIGYFFMQPVIAGSIIVSCLRTAADDLCSDLETLLSSLLRNFGGELRDYLEGVERSDAAFPRVHRVLESHTAYIEGLKLVGDVKELHPSEHRLQIERHRTSDEMQAAMKAANKQSLFFGVVKRSVVLYGLKTLSYQEGPNSERRPFEMELASHGVSHEWPRMETLDPVGLDEMIRMFRIERIAT